MSHDPDPQAGSSSLGDDLRLLIAEARDFATAEVEFQKTRATVAAQGVKAIAPLVLLALGFVLVALMALPIGLVLGLAPLVGPWLATGIVVLMLLVLAGLTGLLALARWRKMKRALAAGDSEHERG